MSNKNRHRGAQRGRQSGNPESRHVESREWSPSANAPNHPYASSPPWLSQGGWAEPSWPAYEPPAPEGWRQSGSWDSSQDRNSRSPRMSASTGSWRQQNGRDRGEGYGSDYRAWPSRSHLASGNGEGSSEYSPSSYGSDSQFDHDHEKDMSCCGPYCGRGPSGYRRSDDRIAEDINERLARHGLIDATDVEVSVADGIVTLTGMVEGREAKRIAEDIAEDCSGVKQVINQVRTRPRGQANSRSDESSRASARGASDRDTTRHSS